MKRILMLAFAGLLFLGWGASEASAWHYRRAPRHESGVILQFDFGAPVYPRRYFYDGPYYRWPYYSRPYSFRPYYGGPYYHRHYYGAPRGPWRDRD